MLPATTSSHLEETCQALRQAQPQQPNAMSALASARRMSSSGKDDQQQACSVPSTRENTTIKHPHHETVFPLLSLGTGSDLKLGKGWHRNLTRTKD